MTTTVQGAARVSCFCNPVHELQLSPFCFSLKQGLKEHRCVPTLYQHQDVHRVTVCHLQPEESIDLHRYGCRLTDKNREVLIFDRSRFVKETMCSLSFGSVIQSAHASTRACADCSTLFNNTGTCTMTFPKPHNSMTRGQRTCVPLTGPGNIISVSWYVIMYIHTGHDDIPAHNAQRCPSSIQHV